MICDQFLNSQVLPKCRINISAEISATIIENVKLGWFTVIKNEMILEFKAALNSTFDFLWNNIFYSNDSFLVHCFRMLQNGVRSSRRFVWENWSKLKNFAKIVLITHFYLGFHILLF